MNVKLDGIEFVLVITLLSFYSQENNSDILKQISEDCPCERLGIYLENFLNCVIERISVNPAPGR